MSTLMVSTFEMLQCMNLLAILMAPLLILAATFIQCKKGKKDAPPATAAAGGAAKPGEPSKSKMGAPPPVAPANGAPPAAPAGADKPPAPAGDKPAGDAPKVNFSIF
uniref:Uncharacterized protein n=1 Tax=Panagrolaimus superbus TaxID=310955 RepID=A0A914YHU9_9BILA